jgi:hypothetical protein
MWKSLMLHGNNLIRSTATSNSSPASCNEATASFEAKRKALQDVLSARYGAD